MNDLPRGWEWTALEAAADILDSRRIPINATERATREGDVPYYGATGRVGWIDDALFDEELVLVGEDGAPFLDNNKPKAYVISGPAWVNNHAHVLRAQPEILGNRFLKHSLDWVDYRPHVNGTTRLKLTQKSMRGIPLPLPPRAEQERIVAAIEEHLSRLDAAEAAIRAVERGLTGLQSSQLNELVSGRWRCAPLGDVLTSLRNGCFVSRPETEPPGLPILRISAVRPMALDTTDVRYAPSDLARAPEYQVAAGDVLFTRYSGNPDYVGACGLVPSDGVGLLHPDKLIRGVPDSAVVTGGWIALAVSSSTGRREIEKRLKTTAGQVGISGSQLKTVPIPVPPLAEQIRRVSHWSDADEAINQLRATLTAAKQRSATLRRSILAAAFSGRLVPQDPDDEPASVLLERIAAERRSATPKQRRRRTASA